MTLDDLCRELHNWFDVSRHFGVYTISNGKIDLTRIVNGGFLQDGQFFRIIGSVFNDGVYRLSGGEFYEYGQINAHVFENEVFDGAIWVMAVSPSVITLLQDINTWESKYSDAVNSPYVSESFGGYSYTKGTSGNGQYTDWRSTFSDRMNKWRKVR
jgi:hypothetical protein